MDSFGARFPQSSAAALPASLALAVGTPCVHVHTHPCRGPTTASLLVGDVWSQVELNDDKLSLIHEYSISSSYWWSKPPPLLSSAALSNKVSCAFRAAPDLRGCARFLWLREQGQGSGISRWRVCCRQAPAPELRLGSCGPRSSEVPRHADPLGPRIEPYPLCWQKSSLSLDGQGSPCPFLDCSGTNYSLNRNKLWRLFS